MKKKMFFGFLIYLFFVLKLFPVDPVLLKKVDLEDFWILKPRLMKVKDGTIFIWNRENYKFCKIKNFEVVRTFGSKGQGPGEFQKVVSFTIIGNRVLIYDVSFRMIEYDIDGNYIKEAKVSSTGGFLTLIEKIDDKRFLSGEMQFVKKGGISPTLFFNSGEKKIKLASTTISLKSKLSLDDIKDILWSVGKDYCYILPSQNSYYIKTFDLNKNRFFKTIEKKDHKRQLYSYKEIKIQREKIKKLKRTTPIFQNIDIKIPKFKPAIKDICSDEKDNLYIVTYSNNENKNLVDVYDWNSEYIKSFYINNHKIIRVEKNKIYLIIEDDTFYLEVYQIG